MTPREAWGAAPPCEENGLPRGSQAFPQGTVGQNQALSHASFKGGGELRDRPPLRPDGAVPQNLPAPKTGMAAVIDRDGQQEPDHVSEAPPGRVSAWVVHLQALRRWCVQGDASSGSTVQSLN